MAVPASSASTFSFRPLQQGVRPSDPLGDEFIHLIWGTPVGHARGMLITLKGGLSCPNRGDLHLRPIPQGLEEAGGTCQ